MLRRAWLVLSLFSVVACSPPPPVTVVDSGVEMDAGVVTSPIELCERISTATCDLEVRCYPAFSRRDRATCIEQARSSCQAQIEPLIPALESGKVAIDDGQLASCERRLTTSACPASFPPSYPLAVAKPFSDCQLRTGLLRGSTARGETCDDPTECLPGTFCVKSNGVCRGTCVAYGQYGEPCGIGCARGLRCDGRVCTDLKGIDEPCQASTECSADLICLDTCRPRRKIGESCRIDLDRLSPCEPGLACDAPPFVSGVEGTCVLPRESFESCRFHWSCKPGLVCADLNWNGFPTSAPAQMGNCREPDGADFNCRATKYAAYIGDACAPGLSCRDTVNKCQALPVRGEACRPSRQDCAGFEVFCKPTGSGDVGICASMPSQGETCAVRLDASRVVAIPCANGFCEKEVTMQCRPPSKTTGSQCAEGGECISGRCLPQPDQTFRCAPPC